MRKGNWLHEYYSSLKKRNKCFKDVVNNYNLYLMIFPPFVLFVLFYYLPMYGVVIAFKNYDIVRGFFDSPWVGFRHFESFFSDYYFFRLIRNTLLIGLFSLFWGFWPPILFALLLNELTSTKIKKIVQSISYLPHFVATVIIVGMLIEFFGAQGLFNTLRNASGLKSLHFFNDPKYFRTLYISSGIWQGMGFGSIIYLSALAGVDQNLYEAAYIDGANRLQRNIYISIPSIMPVITILLILSSANIISVGFEKAYLMQNPLIYETADVISTYTYRRGIINRNFSYATAVGLFNSTISFGLLYMTNKIAKSMNETSLW